jgi:hypothetical protein
MEDAGRENASRLFNAANQPKYFVPISDADHNDLEGYTAPILGVSHRFLVVGQRDCDFPVSSAEKWRACGRFSPPFTICREE